MESEIYYGMFSAEGNERVHAIVEAAQFTHMEWHEVKDALIQLARNGHKEAIDSFVLDEVYIKLGFDSI